MERRNYLKTMGVIGTTALAGCSAGSNGETSEDSKSDGHQSSDDGQSSSNEDSNESVASQQGVLSTAVSDNPGDINDFKHLWVTITEIWVHPKKLETEKNKKNTTAGNNSTAPTPGKGVKEKDGKFVISVDSKEVDLVKLQGDASAVINEVSLPNGTYEQVKLWVSDDTHGILKDGSEVDVTTPGNAPLKFNKEFEVRPATRTTFVADFSPHARGKNAKNGYIVKPVASEVSVSYETIETESSKNSSATDSEPTPSNSTATTTETP